MLLFALIAGILGFGILADVAVNIAVIILIIFIVLFPATLIAGTAGSRWRRW